MNKLTIYLDRRFFLLLLFIAAFILRIYNLNYEGLWNDELFTADTANPKIGIGQVINLLQLDIHPPLHNLLSNLWSRLFSYSDTSLRMFNVLWGMLGVISFYQLAKTLFNKKVAFIALVLVVVNSYLIRYSQEVRAYAMLFVLVNYSVLYLVKLIRGEHDKKNIVAYSLFAAAMLYTHYFGMFVFAFQGVAVLFLVGFKKLFNQIKIWLVAFLIPIALYAFWIPSMIDHMNKKVNPWRDEPTLGLLYDYFKEFFNDLILSTITLVLFVSTVILVLLRSKIHKPKWLNKGLKDHHKALLILVLWIVIYFGIPFAKSSLSASMMVPRYFIGMIAPALLLLAYYLSLIEKRKIMNWALIGVVLYSLLILFLKDRPYYTQTTSYREITKAASEINNDAYVLFVSNHRRYFNYYLQQYNFRKRNGYLKPFTKLVEKDKPEEYFLFLDLRLTPKNFKNKIHKVEGYKEISSQVFRNSNNIKTARLVHYRRIDSTQ